MHTLLYMYIAQALRVWAAAGQCPRAAYSPGATHATRTSALPARNSWYDTVPSSSTSTTLKRFCRRSSDGCSPRARRRAPRSSSSRYGSILLPEGGCANELNNALAVLFEDGDGDGDGDGMGDGEVVLKVWRRCSRDNAWGRWREQLPIGRHIISRFVVYSTSPGLDVTRLFPPTNVAIAAAFRGWRSIG